MTQRFRFSPEDYPKPDTAWEKFLRNLNQLAEAVTKGLGTNGIDLENLAGFTKEVEFTARDEWIPLSLTNGWTAYGSGLASPAYRWRGGDVECRGAVKPGTLTAALATLPVPAAYVVRSSVGDTSTVSSTSVRLDVNASGQVTTTNAPAGLTWVSLDPLRYASSATPAANPCFPLRFRNEGQGKPAGLVVLAAHDVTTSGREISVSLGSPAWSVSKDQVVIDDIAGVLAGRKYRVTIWVIGG